MKAKQLKLILDRTLAELEATDLPDRIATAPVEIIANPFDQ